MANLPFIAFKYDPKVKNFVAELGLSELLLELDNVSLEKIQEKIEYIRENKDRIKEILSEKVKDLKEKALINNNLVFKLLKT
jgi:polysaccharide pyruvyl transferase WcaK-like protein